MIPRSKTCFSLVIDALTDTVHRFGVTQNTTNFDLELDYIVGKMSSVEIETDDNWLTLKDNYSKLKYLNELVNFYNIPSESLFIKSLEKFMEIIDTQNQSYLREIDWNNDYADFRIEASIVKKCIKSSLQRNDIFQKLEDVLKAYEILVCVIEDIRGEKFEYFVESLFMEQFQPLAKRVCS